nr:hypothetical protein [Streptomyces africanus]
MIDAARYFVDNGIKWRAMPPNLPPWPRAYRLGSASRCGPHTGS